MNRRAVLRRHGSDPTEGQLTGPQVAAIGRQAAARPRHDCRTEPGFEDCRLIQSAILVRFREATITARRYRARQRIAHTLTGMDHPAAASRRPMK
jgi:non-ribosomal peptide synthetase component F